MSALNMLIIVFLGLFGFSFLIPKNSPFSSFSMNLPISALPELNASLTSIFSLILGALILVWMVVQFRNASSFPSEGDTATTNLFRKMSSLFSSDSPKSKAKNEVKDLKNKRKKLQKNIKTVKAAREKVLKKLGKISSDSGRVGNYLNERRRNYGRKFMYKWKELFDIEIIGAESFDEYSQRVISHLESELNMINELLNIESGAEKTEEELAQELTEESKLVNEINQEIKDLELTEEKLKAKTEDSKIFIQKVDSESRSIKNDIQQLLQALQQTYGENHEHWKKSEAKLNNIKTLSTESEINITTSVEKLKSDLEELQKVIAEQGNRIKELSDKYSNVSGAVNYNQLLQVDNQGNAQTLITHLEEMKSDLIQLADEIKRTGPVLANLTESLATDMDAVRKQLNAKPAAEEKIEIDEKMLIFPEGTTLDTTPKPEVESSDKKSSVEEMFVDENKLLLPIGATLDSRTNEEIRREKHQEFEKMLYSKTRAFKTDLDFGKLEKLYRRVYDNKSGSYNKLGYGGTFSELRSLVNKYDRFAGNQRGDIDWNNLHGVVDQLIGLLSTFRNSVMDDREHKSMFSGNQGTNDRRYITSQINKLTSDLESIKNIIREEEVDEAIAQASKGSKIKNVKIGYFGR